MSVERGAWSVERTAAAGSSAAIRRGAALFRLARLVLPVSLSIARPVPVRVRKGRFPVKFAGRYHRDEIRKKRDAILPTDAVCDVEKSCEM